MAAYTQFGYSYPTASQLNVGQSTNTTSASEPITSTNPPSLSPGGSGNGTQPGALSPGSISQTSQTTGPLPNSVGADGIMTSSSTCCENGRPIMTDPVTGQVICSCQYDSARLALSGYSRLPSSGVYGTSYPSSDQNPYPSIDSSAFFSPLSNPYALKDNGTSNEMSAWTSAGLQPTTGYYPYDPTLAAYGYGAGYDLASRRKNATRESTATLKAWLNEHKKNPYPTKGEKIMLAIITKMTLTQVSTWFANARRRLKKENKMTWEPKNKTDDDDDAMLSDDEKDKDDLDEKSRDHKDSLHHVKSEHEKDDDDDLMDDDRKPDGIMSSNTNLQHHPYYQHSMAMLGGGHYGNQSQQHHGLKTEQEMHPKNQLESDCGVPIPASKPKIWSLADTAACKTPPLNLPNATGAWGYPTHYQHQQSQHAHQQHPNNSNIMMNIGGNMTPSGHHNPSMIGMSGGMMNTFAGDNFPYSRYTGFQDQSTTAPTQHPFTNNPNHMPIAPLTPTSTTPNLQQQQKHLTNQTMGFPEVLQTDTPPQTPPNMKLPNHLTSNFQPPPTNTMNNNVQTSHTSDLSAYVGNFRIQQNHHSPSSQQHGQIMVTQMQDVTGFKPFYKNNNYVSPV